MANPTTNYGFVLPTPTDLVTDLPADFDVALQGVDTRLKALQPGTTLGDLAYSSATANTNTRLPIGTSGQVLAVSGGGVPAWTTTSDVTPLTTKGDLFTFTTVDARVGVGANGTVLTADSAEATGLKWATPSSGSWTLISTTTLSGSSVSLTSIPSTYNNLKLIIDDYVPSGNATLQIQINSDTSTGRSYAWQEGNATSGGITGDVSYGLTTKTGLNVNNETSAVDNNNSAEIFFDNYKDTGSKFWRSYHSFVKTAVGKCWNLTAVRIDPTSAISSVQIILASGTFSQGTAYLYGSA